jgi:hypothetical protein
VVTITTGGITYNIGSPASATISIQDDDNALPVIIVSATDPTAGEPNTKYGTGTFTFSRSGSTASELAVNFSTVGTAIKDIDYIGFGTIVTFAAGSATATKTVTVINDDIVQATQAVVVRLVSGGTYGIGTPASAIVAIKNDDILSP